MHQLHRVQRDFGDLLHNMQQTSWPTRSTASSTTAAPLLRGAHDATPGDRAPPSRSFEAIDEIALVAVPGVTDAAARDAILAHCAVATRPLRHPRQRRDHRQDADGDACPHARDTNYAAFYFPWIQVFDPATRQVRRQRLRLRAAERPHGRHLRAGRHRPRGVHKAPANEIVRGALGARSTRSARPSRTASTRIGINCIRDLNGNIRVWGARTLGGDANAECKYINVRRLFLFLRESIDEGTQWVVFEPNDQPLWAKITRNVTAFLTNVWRDGRAVRRDARAGVLRQVRRRDQPAGGARPGPGGHRDRRAPSSSRPSSSSSASASGPGRASERQDAVRGWSR